MPWEKSCYSLTPELQRNFRKFLCNVSFNRCKIILRYCHLTLTQTEQAKGNQTPLHNTDAGRSVMWATKAPYTCLCSINLKKINWHYWGNVVLVKSPINPTWQTGQKHTSASQGKTASVLNTTRVESLPWQQSTSTWWAGGKMEEVWHFLRITIFL